MENPRDFDEEKARALEYGTGATVQHVRVESRCILFRPATLVALTLRCTLGPADGVDDCMGHLSTSCQGEMESHGPLTVSDLF